MSQTIKINNGQTLIDASVQHLGDASLAVQSAIDNDVSITDAINNVLLSDADVSKDKTIEVMNKPYNLPASEDGVQPLQGIDSFKIGLDFKLE